MIYCQTINEEHIAVHPMDNMKNTQFIYLTKCGNEPMFLVSMNDCEGDEWYWEFDMTCPSDYERVKLNIFNAIFECDTMVELAYTLDEIFKDGFEDILIQEECECDCPYCGECNIPQ